MHPAFEPGDTLILKKSSKITRGEIAVFTKPSSWESTSGEGSLLIKRVVAVPGDVFSFKNGVFSVNGKETSRLPSGYECPKGRNFSRKLNSKEFIAMGDNVAVSVDSRRIFCAVGAESSIIPTDSIVTMGAIRATL